MYLILTLKTITMINYNRKLTSFFLLLLCLSIINCSHNSQQNESSQTSIEEISGDLIIFHAGSLSVPFKEIVKEFKKEFSEINVILESAGSRRCARKITDINRECDIMASADYKVIENLLIPEYTDWYIKFASNEMAIVYSSKSRYCTEINKTNWYNILLRDDVAFGRSDPNSDPCGYRTVLVNKLAEKYYNKPGLSKKILSKDLNYIRPKEVDLIALLETNAIDYIFLYRSVAEQHKLKYFSLPNEINLKNLKLSNLYSSVSTEISGKKPGDKITKLGEPMIYGVTIIKMAPNYQAAEAFVKFLLTKEKGMKIIEKNGQPSLIPSLSSYYEVIPKNLRKFVKNPS